VRLATLLVAIWLAAMAQLLWHFEAQRIAQARHIVRFDPLDLPAPPTAHGARILYLLPRNCACNAGALAEIARLRRLALLPEAQFALAGAGAESLAEARPLSAASGDAWRARAPETPAVALWNARGELVYFGPIDVSWDCGGDRTYLQDALRSLREGSVAAPQARDVAACACAGAEAPTPSRT
jgi:hypothetical protein